MKKTPFETYGALMVSGNQLTDLQGDPVQLKGLSTHNLSLYPEYVNESFLLQAREEWGVNLIRLAMYTAEPGGYCVEDDANRERLIGFVKDGVALSEKLGMYLIIDWHILSDSDPLMNLDQSKVFWDLIAEHCKDKKNVIFEICNEPNVEADWEKIHRYADQIIPIIRKHAKSQVILIGTPTWSQRVDQAQADPVTISDNLMYVLHFYADTHREDLREIYKKAHETGLPIFVSEFGAVDASGDGVINIQQADAWLDMLDKDQTSYCIWNLSNKDEASAFFKPDCTKVSGFTAEDMREQANWYIGRLQK